MPLSPGDTLDGYTVIRPIGEGGFGEVWLCRSTATGEYRAPKRIPTASGKACEKEFAALPRYQAVAESLRHAPLTPVAGVRRNSTGLKSTPS